MQRCLAIFVLLAWLVEAKAAGGHFDVDDAVVLVPGHCLVEAWVADLPVRSTTNAHLGPACRVGPVELGANLDRPTTEGDSSTSLGPQVKWVLDPIAPRLSAGLVWLASFQRHARPTHTAYGVLTWFAADSLQLHANLGADWASAGGRTRRWGGSVEWAASDAVTLLVERVRIADRATERAGLRFSLDATTSIDLSVARVGDANGYVIGLNREFAR